MESYTINEVAAMTGFSTRTLRNYINMGILNGEKTDGVWKFTPDNFIDFISDTNVACGIKSKINAQALDFLADDAKKDNHICTVMDFYVSDEESGEISDFFCGQMNRSSPNSVAKFSLQRNGKNTRVTLTGPEDIVSEIICGYYSR